MTDAPSPSSHHATIDAAEHAHASHGSHASTRWLWALGIGITAIVLAPHLLPSFGLGEKALSVAIDTCNAAQSSGAAGMAANVLSHVPMIGTELTKGGWMNSLVSAGIGIGGGLLANYLEKGEDGSTHVRWSKVLRTVAISTSLFVALPALFPAINMGLIYLGSMLLSTPTAEMLSGFLVKTLGMVKGATIGVADGLGAGSFLFPHLLSCGASISAVASSVGSSVSVSDAAMGAGALAAATPHAVPEGVSSLHTLPHSINSAETAHGGAHGGAHDTPHSDTHGRANREDRSDTKGSFLERLRLQQAQALASHAAVVAPAR